MNFAEYFYFLLHRIFKRCLREDSAALNLAQALGPNYDDAMDALYKMLEQTLVATATDKALDQLGRERGILRYADEADDDYRGRLLSAYSLYAAGGTAKGIKQALELHGYPDAEIYEWFKEGVVIPLHNGQQQYTGTTKHQGGIRWAEFNICLGIDDDKDYAATERKILLAAINRLKPAHTRLTAIALQVALDDRIALREHLRSAVALKVADGVAGPILLHTGTAPYGRKHNGTAFYQSGTLRETLSRVKLAVDVGQDIIPGCRTYKVAYRHDGGGMRFKHGGSCLRLGFYQHDGQARRDMGLRYQDGIAYYGDKALLHGGLIRYGTGLLRNGNVTHGANGLDEDLKLVIRRKGRPVEFVA